MTSTNSSSATGGVDLEAATQRVRELSEQVVDQARRTGWPCSEGYERVLKNMLDLEEQAAKGTGAGVGDDPGDDARQLRPRDVRGRSSAPCAQQLKGWRAAPRTQLRPATRLAVAGARGRPRSAGAVAALGGAA